jgi:energy-coupling factor transporter ATP-binding protein EcfA2
MTGDWNGSRWWKFEFHTHTPASNDYGNGALQQELKLRTPAEWLLDHMRAGIDCVAITDHNSGEWIDKLKSALGELESQKPHGFRPLHLFPGVEISVNGGIHLLAVFGKEKSTADINTLLGAVEFGGTKGHSDDVTRKTLVGVVEEVVKQGGIAIPAHADASHGLFVQQQGATLEQILKCKEVFAMELVNQSYDKPAIYNSNKIHWTEVLGSDSHHPPGEPGQRFPGSHYTWVKMGQPSIEGLRLALLDGALSVKRSDRQNSDPNQHAELMIESIEVKGAAYMGREQPFTLSFNPWLNAVIGGRGTGKSTLVEFLRVALRRDEELPEELNDEFVKYRQVTENRGDGCLLTSQAAITVGYRSNATTFRVQWSPDGTLDPIQEYEQGKWRKGEGDIRQRFPVRIYSQKQIFQTAKTPHALLQIIDESPEVDYRSWQSEWSAEEARYLSLRAKAREIQAGLSEEPTLRGELDDVKRRLAIFEETGQREILKDLQKRRKQKQVVETWERSWVGVDDRLRLLAEELEPEALDPAAFDMGDARDKDLHALAAAACNKLALIAKQIEQLAANATSLAVEWKQSVDESAWAEAVEKSTGAYEVLRKKLAEEHAGDISSYGTLVQRRQVIEQRLAEMGDRRKQITELETQWKESFQALFKMRRILTEKRTKFLQEVLSGNQHVRIRVLPYGSKETLEAEFRKLIQRESGGFEKYIGTADKSNATGLLGEIYHNLADAASIETSLAGMKEKVRSIASGNAPMTAAADKRFATYLANLPPESIDRLDLWFPDDSLDVQYSTQGNQQNFRPIQEGSPGQKTAAILAFLLSYGNEPLILDQPEDDLDNHLIYDLVVAQLREAKQRRQIIVVTHNANIVVNGDAELVVALCARGGQTRIEVSGCLQEEKARNTICSILEGGREAFDQRYRRIVQESRNV